MRKTDPEHIDFIVSELRDCHRTLYGLGITPASPSTYSLAADLITDLADKLAVWESVLTDLAGEDFRGPEPYSRAVARRALEWGA